MAGYASAADVQSRMTRTMSSDELAVCTTLLEDAATMLDALAPNADAAAKSLVSIRMTARAMGDGDGYGVPQGATQGSMSALGYTQSWTLGTGSGAGELYITKLERQMLGLGRAVGSYSPVEELVCAE